MNRLRPLDGIRGIAVALVVLHHWTLSGHAIGLGNIGVQLFFVLSGFLITGILLKMRAAREAGRSTLRAILASFWQSRAARIVPVVVVTLVAVWLAGDRFEKRADMPWHFAFLSNFLFFARGTFDGSLLAHFWTLAVEQQFYLVWPAIVLFTPRRWMEAAIVALVVVAPVSRFALYAAGYDNFAQFNVLPFANFDSLGMGALIALWASATPAALASRRRHVLAVLAAACAAAIVANRALGPLPANAEQTLFAIAFGWIVARAAEGTLGAAGRVLASRALVGLGVISYGVYAYHVFAPRAVGAGLRAIGAPAELHAGIPLFVLSALLTLAVACVSWFAMERPINNARRNWQRRAEPQASLNAA